MTCRRPIAGDEMCYLTMGLRAEGPIYTNRPAVPPAVLRATFRPRWQLHGQVVDTYHPVRGAQGAARQPAWANEGVRGSATAVALSGI
jgi:hypothetical protein